MRPRERILLAGLLAVASVAPGQTPTPSPPPKAPPPLRLPFTALVPEARIAIDGASDFAASAEALWISSRASGEVRRVDPKTNVIAHKADIGKDLCVGLASDFGALFAPRCQAALIARIDVKTNAAGEPIPASLLGAGRAFATGVGGLWVIADLKGTIARLDPVTNAAVGEIYTAPGASSLAFGERALWVANPEKNTVTRVNPHNNLIVETISIPGGPTAIVVGEGSVWTWNRADGSLSRIDPVANTVAATIKLADGTGEARLAAGEGSLWVSRAGATLTRIDARTNQVAQIFTGKTASPLLIAHGSLWMTASEAAVFRLDPKRIEATRTAVPPRHPPAASPGASSMPSPAAVSSPRPSPTPSPTPAS